MLRRRLPLFTLVLWVAATVSAWADNVDDLVKALMWDGQGLCLYAKRLERGRFVWPKANEGTIKLTTAQLSMLLEGIDYRMPCMDGAAGSGGLSARQIDSVATNTIVRGVTELQLR